MPLAKLILKNAKQSMNRVQTSLREVFKENTERLYKRMMIVFIILCSATLLLQVIGHNYEEALFSGLSTTILILISVLFNYKKKVLSYHLLILYSASAFLYMIIIQGSRYEAFLLFYPTTLLFCFIFFDNFKTHTFYLIFMILNQLLLVYFNSGAAETGFSAQLFAEFVNIIAYNIAIFLMINFYLSSLRKTKLALDQSLENVNNQTRTLKDKNAELSDYMESNLQLENYAYMAAHELKAPLRSIEGFSEILHDKIEDKLTDNEKGLFKFITENAAQMSNLLVDLNDLSQVSKTELIPESFDVTALFEEIKMDRRHTIEEQNATISYIGEVTEMVGQRTLLKQLFSNLIGNGIKFSHRDVAPIVNIKAYKKDNVIHFEIADNGIGIDAEFRDKVFQIFTRLHSSAKYEGSGLGLAISKKIIDMHKGTIFVKDSDLGGCCFAIHLPVILPKKASTPTVKQMLVDSLY